ncbi:1-acyl-sn-glycerol-3-phosphate acyltransferase alpha [Strongylocentrotus purpuratus]|uniref:1-acyl-sn-glycerol-3-phosphate acyltransferase n=1 Tax=Strongylocentrotus purpuratus TaxID=7668 RepID=A0A7M7RA23_STRPU|nr:1-acyl-sn-glycerol-3-phosphate acyltransferase alpha [Strongylocentrotus purpuratus]|eukprot:XP_781558.2 PREDICTED: 1-acyl-sn-glycerol-3-phosphate acyltransferase alpha [Strongylocentrotus purpuratus]
MELDWMQIVVISVLLGLILLYELSNTFKYYAKMTLYYTLLQIQALIIIILSLPRPRDPSNHRWASMLLSNTNGLFGIRAEVRGLHHLDYNKPAIVVANHQSSIDLMSMFSFGVWPKRCVVLGKKELLFFGPFGVSLYLCGTVFVDRLNPEKARSTMEKTAQHIKDKNIKVWIFPEGTRNRETGLLPFKKGAFHLAVQAQVPVIPIVFSSYSDFYSHREKRFGTGKFTITVLPPVSTEGKTSEDVNELTETVRKQMLTTYNETSMQRMESNGLN